MGVAPVIDESPQGHIEELRAMQSTTVPARNRVLAIAAQYVDVHLPHAGESNESALLLIELKAARLRFGLTGEATMEAAIKALEDPIGW